MAWIAAVAALGSAYVGSRASEKAGDRIAGGSAASNAVQERIFEQTRADYAPYRQSGYNALNAMNRAMGLPSVDATSGPFGSGSVPQGYYEIPGAERGGGSVYADRDGNLYDDKGQQFANVNDLEPGSVIQGVNYMDRDGLRRNPLYWGEGNFYSRDQDLGRLPTEAIPVEGEFMGGSETNPDDRYGGFYESPGYQFRMDETLKGATRAASAGGYLPTGGGGMSGRFSREMARYSGNLASEEFGNYFNRLGVLAGFGTNANNSLSAARQNYASNVGAGLMRASDAQASSIVGQANAWGRGLEQGGRALGEWWGT